MGITKTLGGDRLGSGSKMKVHMHGYERSTHDMGYLWRSTMSAGTLVPFITEVALPGDTFDIELDCDIKTHPTVGPLFASYKVQLDVFLAPIRLYQAMLHNNKMGIGLNMASIKLPLIKLVANGGDFSARENIDSLQINSSCLLNYLGIRGVGYAPDKPIDEMETRDFCGVATMMYYDTYKNYYANKQETNGYIIHTEIQDLETNVDELIINGISIIQGVTTSIQVEPGYTFQITGVATAPILNQIVIHTTLGDILAGTAMQNGVLTVIDWEGIWSYIVGPTTVTGWDYVTGLVDPIGEPKAYAFPLADIDEMREEILTFAQSPQAFYVGFPSGMTLSPFKEVFTMTPTSLSTAYKYTQEGLALKTYQSDLFNNWLNEETIDGTNGINEITAIDTSAGFFNLDTLNLSKKVYEMLNRIAVSGGTYDDWQDAVWSHDRYRRMDTPIYQGGLIKELVFQEVISNAETQAGEQGEKPLGTIGGKGIMGRKHKGGHITINVDEPSWIMALISLTPRIDYSQGNKWDVHLKTMDDLHKPALDEIGFQDLITEQMAWWDTKWDPGTDTWIQKSAGKQPAWINYMTNVNRVYGNFAEVENEMFMTLNRRYEWDGANGIKDLTTYIDPVKFNYSFARTAIDAQNFWVQISVDMTARRKMSARLMPNL